MDINNEENVNQEEPSLLNQGTFGCIYKPEFSCNNKPFSSNPFKKKMVSKITNINSNITQEIELGKFIQTIPYYDKYFAPILNTCPINIGEINQEELQACQFIQNELQQQQKKNNSPPIYNSNTIRFVGQNSLYNVLYNSSFPKILTTHIHLLKALTLLQTSLDDPIIHYDLKENNIIFDDIYSIPIIIDFGISFLSSKLKSIDKDSFYVYYEKYAPWCIEIVIISYIVHNIDNRNMTLTDQDISKLKSICSIFVKKNPIFENGFYTDELLEFENNLLLFMDSFVSKNWNDLIQILVSNHLSWDNYSLAGIYHAIIFKWSSLYDVDSIDFNNIKPFLVVYIKIIKDILLSTPLSQRLKPQETQKLLIELGTYKI